MDPAVQRLLNDKAYDKRKQGALESVISNSFATYQDTDIGRFSLEKIVREAIADREYNKIGKVVDQLCNEYAYAVHQPHARNGGLIGLAAAAIALGSVRQHPSFSGRRTQAKINSRMMSLDTSSLSFLPS